MARSVKQARDQLREELAALGCTQGQVAEEMARRFGLRPRAAWRHAMGWPQWKVVQEFRTANPELPISAIRVSEWEVWPHGGTRPSPEALAGLAAVYRCAVADLVDAVDLAHMTPGQRTLLTSPPSPSAPPRVALADRVTGAIRDPARFLDSEVLAAIRLQLDVAQTLDGRLGAAAALPGALGAVSAVTALASDAPEPVRRDTLVLAARAAEFVGWCYRDLADTDRARLWYDRAMEWAQASGDLFLQGFLLIRKSQMAYDQADGARVLCSPAQRSRGPGA